MNDEIRTMMAQIKRMRQWNAAYCVNTGIVYELPRCRHCGELVPWCDCVDPMEYRKARETPETTGRIILHGKMEVY